MNAENGNLVQTSVITRSHTVIDLEIMSTEGSTIAVGLQDPSEEVSPSYIARGEELQTKLQTSKREDTFDLLRQVCRNIIRAFFQDRDTVHDYRGRFFVEHGRLSELWDLEESFGGRDALHEGRPRDCRK